MFTESRPGSGPRATRRPGSALSARVDRHPVARFLRRHPTASGYLVLLASAELVYAALSRPDQYALRGWASTNVANLHNHPIGALLVSVFIPAENPLAWLALVCLGMFATDGLLGGRRALLLVAAAHGLGTLLSEGIVALQVSRAALPRTALSQDDIGPSYLVVSALTLAVLYGWLPGAPRWARFARPVAGLVGLFALRNYLFSGFGHLEVTAVGHATSMVTAATLGGLLLWHAHIRTRLRHQRTGGGGPHDEAEAFRIG